MKIVEKTQVTEMTEEKLDDREEELRGWQKILKMLTSGEKPRWSKD